MIQLEMLIATLYIMNDFATFPRKGRMMLLQLLIVKESQLTSQNMLNIAE